MLQHLSKTTQLFKSEALKILRNGKTSEKFIFVRLVFHVSGGSPQTRQRYSRLHMGQPVDKNSLLYCMHISFQEERCKNKTDWFQRADIKLHEFILPLQNLNTRNPS
jgi:hypothetical protein